jgi:hypothetical protein
MFEKIFLLFRINYDKLDKILIDFKTSNWNDNMSFVEQIF